MKHILILSITILAALHITSCRDKANTDSAPKYTGTPVKIERLDLAITDLPSSTPELLNSLRAGLDIYLPLLGFSADSAESALPAICDSPLTKTFGLEVRDEFPSADSIEYELGRISHILADTLPDIPLDRIFGVISPYNQSVVVADSTVLVALNHYMGSSYAAYSAIPEPIRRLKTRDRIPIDIAEALIRIKYPFSPSDNPSILERMLYEGAVATALATLFPDSGPEYIFGLDTDTYTGTTQSIPRTWTTLSASGLLYSTDAKAFRQLFSRMPNPGFPRYSGPVLGWFIVRNYIAHYPSTPLNYLLSSEFYQHAQSRLIEAKYDPQASV